MAGKRKRTYRSRSYRRPYRRRRSSNTKLLRTIIDDDKRMAMFGPSAAQTLAHVAKGGDVVLPSDAQRQARRALRYYGDGSYWSDAGDWFNKNAATWGKNIGHWGSRIGGALVGAGGAAPETGGLGVLAGGLAGWQTGAEASKAAGWGSYRVNRGSNDLITQGNGSAPIYHSAGAADDMGDVIISNRELVELVRADSVAGKFSVKSFTLNPADATFHHLAQQSKQYEQFEFLGCIFEYVPMTGEGGSNELGVIGMAANYDPSHTREFADLETMMRFKGSTTCKPSVGMAFGIECDPSKRSIKTMYVRDGINRDKDFTEPGTFYLASQGAASNQILGQLWVTYTCKLRNIKSEVIDGPKQQGVAWTGTPTAGLSALTLDTGSPLVTLTNVDADRIKVTLNASLAKDSCFGFSLHGTNHGSVADDAQTNPEAGTLVGCEFVPITGYVQNHWDSINC